MEKIKLKYPLLVEGIYDKNLVLSVAEGTVICSDGFGLFKAEEKQQLLRRITESGKLLVLTDSDGAGMLIRNKLRGYLGAGKVINIYTPTLKGKEKRKKSPSKEGLLGVEGMDRAFIAELLVPFSEQGSSPASKPLTAPELYNAGLSGREGAVEKRRAFCRAARLPETLGAKPLLEAVNLLGGAEFFYRLLKEAEI